MLPFLRLFSVAIVGLIGATLATVVPHSDRVRSSASGLSWSALPHNASWNFIGACEGTQHIAVSTKDVNSAFATETPVRITSYDRAGDAMTTMEFSITGLNVRVVCAGSVGGNTVFVHTNQQLWGASMSIGAFNLDVPTNGVVRFDAANDVLVVASAVEGAKAYNVTAYSLCAGYSWCIAYELSFRALPDRIEVQGAPAGGLYIARADGVAAIYDVSTGAQRGSALNPALAASFDIGVTTASLVIVPATMGENRTMAGVSWSTAETVWTQHVTATSLRFRQAGTEAKPVIVVNTWSYSGCFVATFCARTGDPLHRHQWQCNGYAPDSIVFPVANQPSLIAIAGHGAAANVKRALNVTVADVYTGGVALQQLPWQCGGKSCGANTQNNIIVWCGGELVALRRTGSTEGLAHPVRLTIPSQNWVSSHAFAEMPTLSCPGNGSHIMAWTSRSFMSIDITSLSTSTNLQAEPSSEKRSAIQSRANSPTIETAWNVTFDYPNGPPNAPLVDAVVQTLPANGTHPKRDIVVTLVSTGYAPSQPLTLAAHDMRTGNSAWAGSSTVCSAGDDVTQAGALYPTKFGVLVVACATGGVRLFNASSGFQLQSLPDLMVAEPIATATSLVFTALNTTTQLLYVRSVGMTNGQVHYTIEEPQHGLYSKGLRGLDGGSIVVVWYGNLSADHTAEPLNGRRSVLFAFNVTNGRVLWRHAHALVERLPCAGLTSGVGIALPLFVTLSTGGPGLVILDPLTGSEVSTKPLTLGEYIRTANVQRGAPPDGLGCSCSNLDDGFIIVSVPAAVFNVSIASGSAVWHRFDERLFVPAAGNDFASGVVSSAATVPTVAAAMAGGGAWLIDAASGAVSGYTNKTTKHADDAQIVAIISTDMLLTLTDDGLALLDATSGDTRAEWHGLNPHRGRFWVTPAASSGAALVVGFNGYVGVFEIV